MSGLLKVAMLSAGMALLWASVVAGMQGYGGARGGFGSGAGRGWVQFRGHVLCNGCTLNTEHRTATVHLYELTHRRGQVVMQVTAGESTLPYHRLWLKGEDRLFETLAAEENLFKEIEIAGLLREYLPTCGILDLPTVQRVDEGKSVREE